MDATQRENRSRDATSLRLLGGFFCVLGTLLMVGVWWARDDYRAAIVSVVSSLVILSVGVGMLLTARRLRRAAPLADDATDAAAEPGPRTEPPHAP